MMAPVAMRSSGLAGLSATGLAVALAAVAVAPAGAGIPPGSGVRGIVLYGPTCPVQRPGQTCERPLAATLTFLYARSRGTAARTRSGPDGRFSAALRPGRYLLKVNASAGIRRTQSQTVSVTAHRYARVTIRFDSGVR